MKRGSSSLALTMSSWFRRGSMQSSGLYKLRHSCRITSRETLCQPHESCETFVCVNDHNNDRVYSPHFFIGFHATVDCFHAQSVVSTWMSRAEPTESCKALHNLDNYPSLEQIYTGICTLMSGDGFWQATGRIWLCEIY